MNPIQYLYKNTQAQELTVQPRFPELNSSTPREESSLLSWLELPITLVCWLGIAGLIILITRASWADPQDKSGFLPGARPFNPFSNTPGARPAGNPPPPGNTRGPFLFDDDEDDEDDLDFQPAPKLPPARVNPTAGALNPRSTSGARAGSTAGSNLNTQSPLRTFSAGGTPNNAPEPIRKENGIAVGGTTDIVSKNKIEPIRIDSETGEGSKEMITDFNFPDADILDIAKTLGKLTGKNFILDKDVKGRITIISNSSITVSEAWKAFLTALDMNGFSIIPSGKYLRIARQRDARDKQLKTYVGDYSPDTDALITRVFPLKYISSEEVARTFRSFMPANSRIIPYEQTNTVIVTDTGSNIAKLAKMLELLDVEGYDAGIEVIPVKYASASELSKLIDTLIPGTSGTAGGAGAPRFGGGGLSRFTARRTKEGGIINTIISDERTNNLIVHANQRGADQVRELVAKLDQKLPPSVGGGRVRVIYLQFADAEQIASTLNTLSQSTGGRSSPPSGGGGTGTGVNPVAGALFEGSIKIAPDKATNSLVITASPTDFVTVQRVISQLDIPRNQVYVEVIIMEVSLENNFDFSANIVSAPSFLGSVTNTNDLTPVLQNPLNLFNGNSGITTFRIGQKNPVTVNGQTFDTGSVLGLIKFIQATANANVLATPQIIALDNAEATFESSEKIPIPVTNAVQGAGTQSSFQFQPITLSIKIKPQINKITNYVKLDVTSKLGDISPRTLPKNVTDNAFATLDRTATTTVVVGDSDTVVLGGLIRDKISETVNKIPLLGDIPILGWLFKSKSTRASKSNLLIFMTPHIVRQYEKVRTILDKKLKERDDFIEKNAGGDDFLREARDKIIRSLPDIEELERNRPPASTDISGEEQQSSHAATPVESSDSPSSHSGTSGKESSDSSTSSPASRSGSGPSGEKSNSSSTTITPTIPLGSAPPSSPETPVQAPSSVENQSSQSPPPATSNSGEFTPPTAPPVTGQ